MATAATLSGLFLALGTAAVAAHAGGAVTPVHGFDWLLRWQFDPLIALPLAVFTLVYLALARRVSARHPGNPWPRLRTGLFLGAIVTLALALLSPVDTFSDDLLSVHMVQHMLLMMVAAPLLAASAPGTLALRAARQRIRRRVLLPIVHGRVVGFLTFPVTGWLAFTVALWASHLTDLYNIALANDAVHALEHGIYLAAACLLWWPIFSPDPIRWRLHPAVRALGMTFQIPSIAFLSVILMSAPTVLYPAYIERAAALGVDPLTDQRAGAAIMWISGTMMMVIAILVVLGLWMQRADREMEREDARLDREAAARPGGEAGWTP